MATGHGDVYHIEPSWEYDSDHDASSTSTVDITGLGAGLQFDMRHGDTRGALYSVVIGRDDTGFQRSHIDRNIWSHTGICA